MFTGFDESFEEIGFDERFDEIDLYHNFFNGLSICEKGIFSLKKLFF